VRRWLTTVEVGEQIAKRDPKVAELTRRGRREHVIRVVKRIEKMEDLQCIKRVGRSILVSWRALESLLPADAVTIDRLDTEMGKLNHVTRAIRTQVNGHGSQLRNHRQRLGILEELEAARREYDARVAEISRRA
jgi:hypothetical protein